LGRIARGLTANARYFRTKQGILVSGRAQALRYFNRIVDGVTGRLAPFRYKVRGIGLTAIGSLDQSPVTSLAEVVSTLGA